MYNDDRPPAAHHPPSLPITGPKQLQQLDIAMYLSACAVRHGPVSKLIVVHGHADCLLA